VALIADRSRTCRRVRSDAGDRVAPMTTPNPVHVVDAVHSTPAGSSAGRFTLAPVCAFELREGWLDLQIR
jgi:hypothetical protein